MHTNGAPEPGTPEDLRVVEDALARVDAAMTEAALALGRLHGSGICESVEGLEVEHWLRLTGKLPDAAAKRVVVTGEQLGDLAHLRGLLERGAVSYATVQAICGLLRGLSHAQRQVVDARLAATVVERGGVEAFGADGLIEAVATAVDDLRRGDSLRRRETRREQRSWFALQPRLDGSGGTCGGDLGPQSFAAIANGLQQALCDAEAAGDTPEQVPTATPDQPAARPERRPTLTPAQRNALALRRMAACYLGRPVAGEHLTRGSARDGNRDQEGPAGTSGPGEGGVGCCARRGWRPARPLFEVAVDLSDVCTATAGVVLGGRGDLPRLTARLTDLLSDDADLRAVLFDGANPLAVSAIRRARDRRPPEKIRLAVRLRDKGDRFPASRLGLADCDLDHLRPRAEGGSHHPGNVAAISRRINRHRHTTGWQLRLDSATGEVTATRRHRRWRSLPRGTPLARPPADHDPPPQADSGDLPF